MFPSLRPSFRLKLQLVSALALTVALQAFPASAMDTDDAQTPRKDPITNLDSNNSSRTNTTQATPEFSDILEQINYYYENPEKFLDDYASEENPILKLYPSLKVEEEKGNLKAKMLYWVVLSSGEGNKGKAPWGEISNWLRSHNDAISAHWLGIFVDPLYFFINLRPNDEEAMSWYTKAAEKGDVSAYLSLARLYNREKRIKNVNSIKAAEYYLKAIKSGFYVDQKTLASVYNSVAEVYHYGKDGPPVDLIKAEEYYLKAAAGNYAKSYRPLSFLAHNRKEGSRAVHWAIKYWAAEAQTTKTEKYQAYETTLLNTWLLKDYLIPPKVENAVEEVAIISIDEEEAKGIVEQWANASTWLVPLAGKMMWKMGEFSQEGKTKTNVRSHKPSARNHYANFSATLEKANVCFSKSLANNSFSFLMPKTSVKNHLLTQFNVYNPTAPTSSECMGLRMYNIWPYQHMIAFGNENVKLADDVAEVLTGPFSLTHLINHHRGKKTLLEQLRDHKQQKMALPQDLLQLELAILQKPRRLISFDNEAEPTLSFKDHLVEKIKLTGNDISDEIVKRHIDHRLLGMAMALLKKAEGDKTELSKDQIAVKLKAVCGSISEETINLYIDNKMAGVSVNPTFEQCIDHELIQQINQKIAKRTEKVELLEGIVDTFKQMLMVAHPQKVAKFKTDYPDLSDMFD